MLGWQKNGVCPMALLAQEFVHLFLPIYMIFKCLLLEIQFFWNLFQTSYRNWRNQPWTQQHPVDAKIIFNWLLFLSLSLTLSLSLSLSLITTKARMVQATNQMSQATHSCKARECHADPLLLAGHLAQASSCTTRRWLVSSFYSKGLWSSTHVPS